MAAAGDADADRPVDVCVSLNVLLTVRDWQQQHGMRSYDYERYRQYCSRRLRRLHKTLRWFQGTGKKFVKRRMEPEEVCDVRHIELMLLLAERAWGYAQQLKTQAAEKDGNPRLMRHYSARMRKAVQNAREMCDVARFVCDDRTKREMEAYTKEMAGHHAFSKKKWADAKAAFVFAGETYNSLSQGQASELRSVYLTRMNEVDQQIRFCMHKLGEDSKSWKGVDEGDDRQLSTLTFLGRAVPVHSDKLRALIASAEQYAADVARLRRGEAPQASANQERSEKGAWKRKGKAAAKGAAADPGAAPAPSQATSVNKLLDAYDRVFIAINEAIDQVKTDLAQERGGDAGGMHLLVNCLKHRLFTHTLERNLGMCKHHTQRYDAQEAKAAGRRDPAGGKPATPHDLIRLHDTVVHTVEDLLAIPGVDDDEDTAAPLNARVHLHTGLKAHYQGEAFRTVLSDPTHAALMYGEAERELKEGFTYCRQKGLDLEEETAAAHARVRSATCVNKASAVLRKRQPAAELGAQLKRARIDSEPAGARRLDHDFSGYEACGRLTALPPDFESIPCRPIFLDIAHELLPTVSIDHRVIAKETKQRTEKPRKKPAGAAADGGGDDDGGGAAPDGGDGAGGAAGGKKAWFGGWGWGKK